MSTSASANVAVFLSEGVNDGYVQKSGATKTPGGANRGQSVNRGRFTLGSSFPNRPVLLL